MRRSTGPSASVSRWAMPLDGSSSRSTVGRWARRQAGRRCAGSRWTARARTSSGTPRGPSARSARRPARRPSARRRTRPGGAARRGTGRAPRPALERDGEALLDRERREQAGVLERAAEPAPGPRVGAPGGDVAAAEHGSARRRRGVKPEMRSNSVVLPAPFGPMMPRISPVPTVKRHVVDGADAAERCQPTPRARAQLRRSGHVGRPVAADVAGVDLDGTASGAGSCRRRGRRTVACAPSRNTERSTSGRRAGPRSGRGSGSRPSP